MHYQKDNTLNPMMSIKTSEWQMDPYPHYFVENVADASKTEAISAAMQIYERVCAEEKVKLYMRIGEILGIKLEPINS
jgi:hypothetical protein